MSKIFTVDSDIYVVYGCEWVGGNRLVRWRCKGGTLTWNRENGKVVMSFVGRDNLLYERVVKGRYAGFNGLIVRNYEHLLYLMGKLDIVDVLYRYVITDDVRDVTSSAINSSAPTGIPYIAINHPSIPRIPITRDVYNGLIEDGHFYYKPKLKADVQVL